MVLSRREFLWSTTAAGLLVPLAPQAPRLQERVSQFFQHGVASGDPLADRVILWTRVTPPDAATARPVEVRWQVAADPGLTRRVQSGLVVATPERDFTVKVDATGLSSGTPYYFAFDALGDRSPVGRTKTLPASTVSSVRLAVVSCSNYPAGFFNSYACIANRPDLDAVIHLGDYIYEFENGRFGDGSSLGRVPKPVTEAVTLADYRLRYATYRTDPDLQLVHARHPFIVVWDDHELANNAWADGAANHNEDRGEGDWSTRRAAAWRAYLEWMPVRDPGGSQIRLYRDFRFGTLVDLVMLDTRGLRDRQVDSDDLAGLAAQSRTLLGPDQERWLFGRLRASQKAGTRWRLIGQQVMFSRIAPPGQPVQNPDTWDGYQGARDRVIGALEEDKIPDVAFLTGDVHSSWAFDVPRDPWRTYTAASGAGSLAVELITPAVSSAPLFANRELRERAALLKLLLPHFKFLEGERRGYLLVDATPSRLKADWWLVPDVVERSTRETMAASFTCERGSSRLVPS
jgi:alkaline phosphatase D